MRAISWCTVLPKRDSVNRSAGVRPAKIRCSARLAASMLSPFIEPEQSTTTFSRSGASDWSCGTSAQKLASATYPSPSRATVANDVAASRSIASTKSRSSYASWARDTVTPSAIEAVAIRCEGEVILPVGNRAAYLDRQARMDMRRRDR